MNAEIEVSTKAEIEEKHGLDLANGTNGTAHEDADSSYCFVNGKDGVEEADHNGNVNGTEELERVNKDRVDEEETRHIPAAAEDQRHPENGGSSTPGDEEHHLIVQEEGCDSQNPGNGVASGGSEALHEGAKSNLALDLEENNQPHIEVRADKDEGKVAIEHTVKDPPGDHEENGEQNSNSVSRFDANGHSSTNDGKEDDLLDHSAENGTSFEANGHSSANNGNEDGLLNHNSDDGVSETASGPELKSESVFCLEANGHSSSNDGNDDELLLLSTEDGVSETAGLVGSISSPKTSEMLPLNVSAQSDDDFAAEDPSKRVELTNEIPMEGDSGNLVSELGGNVVNDSVPVESVEVLPSSADEVRTEAGEENAGADCDPVDSSEVEDLVAENPSASVSALDEIRVEAEVEKSEENVTESADSDPVGCSGVALDVSENIPPAVVDEMRIESEVGNTEENSRDIADYHSVNPAEATVEVAPVLVADEVRINPEVEKADEKFIEIAGSDPPFVSEIEAKVTESSIASSVDAEIEVVKSEEESKENAESDLAENLEVNVGPLVNGPMPGSPTDIGASESKTRSDIAEFQEIVSSMPNPDVITEAEASNRHVENADSHPIYAGNTGDQSAVADFVENNASLPASEISDLKEEIAAESIPSDSSRDMACISVVATDPGKANDAVVCSGRSCSPNIMFGGIQFSRINEDKVCQELEPPNSVHKNDSPCSPEGSTVDNSEGQMLKPGVGKRQFYLIKVPRYDDENLKEQIRQAHLRVEERTKTRDAFQSEIKKQKAIMKELSDDFEASLSKERAAWELFRSKRQEIDSLLSVINIEDIDGRIRNMEHRISHETLSLKEEKQLIREIKQLKQNRENLSSARGQQDGVQQNSEQKNQVEERLKSLRKEADLLKKNVVGAEAITRAAREKRSKEYERLRKLQAEERSANAIRQEAYDHLKTLKNQSYEKNKRFYQFRDDLKLAYDLASKRNLSALEDLCDSQVDMNLDLWNQNDEYRKDYIRCNMRSTLWRLKTLDGRSLGPDEVPPVIPRVVHDRMAKDVTLPSSFSTPSGETKEQVTAEAENIKDQLVTKTAEKKINEVKPKKPSKSASPANGLATASVKDEIEEVKEEEPKKTKEEEELARKEDELRKEEEAARLMEEHRLEQIAKAKEAQERKKKKEDQAQARAALKAQKEAEEKERERERRLKKKERRKLAGSGEATSVTNEVESAPDSEAPTQTPTESEVIEKQVTTTKKHKKQPPYTKQVKVKSVPPPPLRNRGKRRMQPWMWVLLSFLVIFALFLVGNSNFSFDLGLHRFNF